MTIRNRAQGPAITALRLTLCLLLSGWVLTVGCKSGGSGSGGDNSGAAKKKVYADDNPGPVKEHGASFNESIDPNARPSTPTPTPNRPIDRPLDPAGRPLSSSTPEG
jgi:hypothetical protein